MTQQLINYRQAYKLFNERFKISDEEFKYFLSQNMHKGNVYSSDIQNLDGTYDLYRLQTEVPFYAIYQFYDRKWIETCAFDPRDRFISVQQLSINRNWYVGDNREISETLLNAGRAGLLRWYDTEREIFTLSKRFMKLEGGTGSYNTKNWAWTDEGIAYTKDYDSVFLLIDILKVERIMMNVPLETIMKEFI